MGNSEKDYFFTALLDMIKTARQEYDPSGKQGIRISIREDGSGIIERIEYPPPDTIVYDFDALWEFVDKYFPYGC